MKSAEKLRLMEWAINEVIEYPNPLSKSKMHEQDVTLLKWAASLPVDDKEDAGA